MNICSNCFSDLELKKYIESNSTLKGQCDFCMTNDIELLSLDELMDFFFEFLGIFKKDDKGIPLNKILREDWNLFNPEINIDKLLMEILSRTDFEFVSFDEDVIYFSEISECISYWETLKENLKWERRFLTNIEVLFELGWDAFFNTTAELASDEVLYRSRIHKKEGIAVYKKKEMGCPPKKNVSNGRANPEGIPFLYLSRDLETTFYETRVSFLDEVSLGSFKVVPDNRIVVVDFTEEGSPFLNMGNMLNYIKATLLKRSISRDLSKPIRRYDSQLEYIPTQFICEFIRYITGADGIVFNSSLHEGGVNYVLFDETKFECFKVEKHHVTNVIISTKKK